MNTLFIVISSVFSIVLLYYSVLTVFGLYYRLKRKKRIMLDRYPSVDVLIPAHNEGKVIGKTLEAMVKLQYPGELHIYVLNDNSEDDTGMIADAFAERFKHVHHIRVPQGFPKGKSRVLNYGLEISGSEYFAVYDADNQPEPQALTLLVEAAETTVGAAGAVGYVRTVNEQKKLANSYDIARISSVSAINASGEMVFIPDGVIDRNQYVGEAFGDRRSGKLRCIRIGGRR